MIEIVHELRRARGSIKKMAILNKHKHNEDWKQVLLAMYDTSVNYGVSAPKDKTFVNEIIVDNLRYDLSMLSTRQYTGGQARAHALTCSEEYGEIFRLILGGSLRAGVSVTTINKVYPGLIPVFKVMLAKDASLIRYPVLASTKFDGVRLLAFVYPDNKVLLKLRSGKTIFIESLIKAVRNYEPGVYDGELVSGDGLQAGRTVITGQVNRCLKGSDIDIADYTFCVFDYIPLEAWQRQQCTWMYDQRYQKVTDNIGVNTGYVMAARQFEVRNDAEVEDLYRGHIERGYEGLILRSKDDPYLWTRSATLMKKKAIKEATLMCVGVHEGKGKYEGMVGALMCIGQVEATSVSVDVGSGLSDFDRARPFEFFQGRTVEILYNDVVQAKGSTSHSLFLPRLKRITGDMNI